MKIEISQIIDRSNLSAVKEILRLLELNGPDEETCLYVSFKTTPDEVILSANIKKIYPDEITIVLQYQYHNLKVTDEYFSVSLSFNDMPQTIKVPFCYLTSFAETSSLINFRLNTHLEDPPEPNELEKTTAEALKKTQTKEEDKQEELGQNVVSINRFRRSRD